MVSMSDVSYFSECQTCKMGWEIVEQIWFPPIDKNLTFTCMAYISCDAPMQHNVFLKYY